jgi:hypothetical protein
MILLIIMLNCTKVNYTKKLNALFLFELMENP